jgi:hypothetical protein
MGPLLNELHRCMKNQPFAGVQSIAAKCSSSWGADVVVVDVSMVAVNNSSVGAGIGGDTTGT